MADFRKPAVEPVSQFLGSVGLVVRRLRATTTPVAATPARPASPINFQGTRIDP